MSWDKFLYVATHHYTCINTCIVGLYLLRPRGQKAPIDPTYTNLSWIWWCEHCRIPKNSQGTLTTITESTKTFFMFENILSRLWPVLVMSNRCVESICRVLIISDYSWYFLFVFLGVLDQIFLIRVGTCYEVTIHL
jgi:hypothetical protein